MAKEPGLIGLALATGIGLGAIIGAGIFVLSGTAIAIAGAYALIAFVLVGIVALIVALEYGELCAMFPNARGGAYSYVYKAFGSELGFITGMIAYFSVVTSIAVVALGFGSYLSNLLGLHSGLLSILFSAAMIATLAVVNILGVKKAAEADFGLVIIKILVLLLFIGFAAYLAFVAGHFSASNFFTSASQKGLTAIFGASIAIIFAYSGFGTISTLTSRVKGGAATALKAMVLAVIISITLYSAVVVALILLAPAYTYGISADPVALALAYAHAPSSLFIIVDIGALIATASAALAMMLSASRVMYQMGHDRLLPKLTRKFSSRTDVAVNGILISAALGALMLFAGNVYIVASISSFGILFYYLMVSFSIIHFRKVNKSASFKTPLYPYLTIIVIIIIVAFLIGLPRESLIIGLALITVLLAVYFLLRELRHKQIVRVGLFR